MVPTRRIAKVLTVAEGGTGFLFLAVIVGYLPVMYQAFSRREVSISMLDARAGSPPSAAELLRRHRDDFGELASLLRDWERWSAELLESHLSYNVLSYFRSQHDNESWLAALTTILDACALIMIGADETCRRQAGLTFAMARHAVADLAQVLAAVPRPSATDRLPPAALEELRRALAAEGVALDGGEAGAALALRAVRQRPGRPSGGLAAAVPKGLCLGRQLADHRLEPAPARARWRSGARALGRGGKTLQRM